MVSTDPRLAQRLIPHAFALIAGSGAYLSLGLFPETGTTGPAGVVATLALISFPFLGAAMGSLLAGRRNLRPILRPYLLATLWMWGLGLVLGAISAAVEDRGLIPTDTPREGIVALLLFLGITIVFFWPWFIVPAAQIFHTIRTRSETPGTEDQARIDKYES